MDSKELIKAGRLSEAREQLVKEVKSAPGDPGKRTLLFQVLSLLGEWDKASRHLDMIVSLDPSREEGVMVFKNMTRAEQEREEVFAFRKLPSFMPDAPGYFEPYYTALQKLEEKDTTGADEILTSIREQIPLLSGTVNEEPFSGFCDTDTFLSAFLEAFIHDRYVWVPFESIRELTIAAPKTLTDLVWASASITTWEGLSANCFLPVLYPGSSLHEDDRVKFGRMTDWKSLGGTYARGVGQHVYQVGENDMALLEIREVTFTYPGSHEKTGQ